MWGDSVIAGGALRSVVIVIQQASGRSHHGLYFLLDAGAVFLLGDLEVVGHLQVQPRLGIATEKSRQPQCGIRRDAAPFVDDFADASRGYAQGDGQCIGAEVGGGEEFFPQDFARMDGAHTIAGWAHELVFRGNRRFRSAAARMLAKRATVSPWKRASVSAHRKLMIMVSV